MLLLIVDVDDLKFFAQLEDGDVAVIQIDHLIRIFRNRAGVGGQVILSFFAEADDQRGTLPGADDGVGIHPVQNCDGIGADDLMQSYLDRTEQVQVIADHDVLDELDQYFRVRYALEGDAPAAEILLEGRIVLDDAIVDQGEAA